MLSTVVCLQIFIQFTHVWENQVAIERATVYKGYCIWKDELVMFLTEQKSAFEELFLDNAWVLKLCYLSDIFEELNDMNISLHRKRCNIFTLKIVLTFE